MHWEDRLLHQATLQAGIVGIDQLPDLGLDCEHWKRARRSRRWTALTRRVLAVAGLPDSDERRAHAGILDAGGGAALHGPSTLAWFHLQSFTLATIHVVRRRETTRALPTLAVLHRLRDLRDGDVITVRGVPTVRPIRAIWAEASRFSHPRRYEQGYRKVGRLLDDANTAGILTWCELHGEVERLGRPGRAGTRLMRDLALERPPGSSPTESRNEDRLEEILQRHRRAPLERQRVVGEHEPIGRVDHRDPELPLVVETNSLAFHTNPSDRGSDERRYEALVSAGFVVAVIWEPDLWSHPGVVVDTVDEGRRRARRGAPSVIHSRSCPWPFDEDRILIGAPTPPYRG
ncbi:MAG: hypothetical protein U5K30_00715 [Acidimicrobiales bacterium]|nr:hypothetical protein [Acidimicrobiales bacterium]